jgi:drug/metabolite transporter (DMT)-like permease
MGALYMLGSAFCFSVMSLLVKLAGQGLPSQEIVVARSAFGVVLGYSWLRRSALDPWRVGHRGLLLLRGLLGFGALTCFFYALTRLPLAEATVLQFTSPVLTAILAALLLGEGIGRLLPLSLVASGVGVVLITRPAAIFGAAAVDLDAVAVVVGLLGAALSASAYIVVRRLSAEVDPLVIVFYFALVATPASVITAAPVLRWPTALEWLVLAGIGVVTQLAQVMLTRGLMLETAGRATAIGYAQILFAVLGGLLFFGEVPDRWALAGSGLVVAGTLAIGLTRSHATRRPSVAN